MYNKWLVICSHNLYDRGFYKSYKCIKNDQSKGYNDLKRAQEKQLTFILRYAYKNVPYYHDVFKDLNIDPMDIRRIEDLERLPILTKEIINKNWDSFIPHGLKGIGYINRATGGSTGSPLKYRITKFERILAWALTYNGWGYAGYELGDKTVFLGGSSLNIGTGTKFVTKVHEIVRNVRKLSSFDMEEKKLQEYAGIMNSFKPKFIYGYPSSLNFFSNWIIENGLQVHNPKAIFTTSEKLYPHMREKIEEAFNSEVYDSYGLNDGGLTSFECSEHNGLHINTERAVMEVINNDGDQIESGEGRIIATSLYNYAMPFIRYETGDIGSILSENEKCNCGMEYRLLKEVVGRSVDMLLTPEGKNIHGWFFLYTFWQNCKGIKEYQVVQERVDKITIKIVPESNFDEAQLETIRNIISKRSKGWDIKFEIVDKINRTKSGKYKFVENRLNKD